MADDVPIKDATDATRTIATDDVGSGRQAQFVKLLDGTDGSASSVKAATAEPAAAEVGLVVRPVHSAGTLSNGVQTNVSSAAVQVLAANAVRKKLILQNTGSSRCRIGTTGLTAGTGVRLEAGEALIFDRPDVPTNAIFAIRDASTDTTVLAQEVT